jgi:putative transposase
MPRSARLDIPGVLQHVIVRGNERRNIFLGDADRIDFTGRFQVLLKKMDVQCLAWSLMSNHFHLLLRPTRTTLAQFMRRLLTGYAVSFNLRHKRSGHLFQNRYKSLICDEDAYLLELVRYIHLNPLRAGLVDNLESLDRYPWAGHSVLLGNRSLEGQATEEVLGCFGNNRSRARRGYRCFLADGAAEGHRPELVGCRPRGESAGAAKGDGRILGDEDFAERLRGERALERRISACEPLEAIIARVAADFGVMPAGIASKSRQPKVVEARRAVCRIATEAGYTGAEIARRLGMTRGGVCAAKGQSMSPAAS